MPVATALTKYCRLRCIGLHETSFPCVQYCRLVASFFCFFFYNFTHLVHIPIHIGGAEAELVRALDWRPGGPGFEPRCGNFA